MASTCLKSLRASGVAADVIVITGEGSIKLAVEAMRYGASDFLVKPFAHRPVARRRADGVRTRAREGSLTPQQRKRARLLPSRTGPDAERVCGIHRQFRADEFRLPAAHERGLEQRDGVRDGRERHRQGIVRRRAASPEQAQRRSLRRHQLRGHSEGPARKRDLRPCERRLHMRPVLCGVEFPRERRATWLRGTSSAGLRRGT